MTALCLGILFLIRWICQIVSSLSPAWLSRQYDSLVLIQCIDWIEVLPVKLILEVMGAAGAIWGCSQIVLLRTDETIHFWRIVSIMTLFGFLLRWIRIVVMFVKGENNWHGHAVEELEKRDSEIHDLVLTETHTLNESGASSSSPSYQSTP